MDKTSNIFYLRGVPILSRRFDCPPWISTTGTRPGELFILQAAYYDRYGTLQPSLGASLPPGRDKFVSYKVEKEIFAMELSMNFNGSEDTLVTQEPTSLQTGANSKNLQSKRNSSLYFVDPTMDSQSLTPEEQFKTDLRSSIVFQKAKFDSIAEKVRSEHSLRIFLSSPFLGCEAERKQFMEIYYPVLNSYCQKKGISLSVIDFSWGISDHMVANFLTIRTCLHAIDSTDIFLGYYGARYGSSKYSGADWVLRSIEECSNIYPYLHTYSDRSATEIEWQHAFLHEQHATDKAKPLSFFFFRDQEYDLAKAAELSATNKSFMYTAENEKSAQLLEDLRQNLKTKVQATKAGCLLEKYENPLVCSKLMFLSCEFIIQRILDDVYTQSPGDEIRFAHLSYARFKTGVYIEPEDILTAIFHYIQASDTSAASRDSCFALVPNSISKLLTAPPFEPPLVVTGGSGMGKSSVLAAIILSPALLTSHKLIYHFVGCNRGSTDLHLMLVRIYNEFKLLCHECGVKRIPDVERIETNEIFPTIIAQFVKAGNSLPPIVIVIDALNELLEEDYNDEKNRPSGLLWLPKAFPVGMRVVLSCLHKCEVYNGEMLNRIALRRARLIAIEPLSLQTRRRVVEKWHENYLKTVDERMMSKLWEHTLCENPMYLSLVIKGLISYGTYNSLLPRITRYLEAESIPALINMGIDDVASVLIIDEIEGSRDDLVRLILQFIYCSREGLSVIEIIELLDAEQTKVETRDNIPRKTRLNQSSWVVVSYLMQQLIVLRHGLYNFTHDYVRKAVQLLYFSDGGEVIVHRSLALYFKLKGDDSDAAVTFLDEYSRPTRELLYHERKAKVRPSVLVAARVRPFSKAELRFGTESTIRMQRNQVMLVNPISSQPSIFTMDFTFDSSGIAGKSLSDQAHVSRICKESVISQLMSGFNASILAYGQTGSGKSYTMFGPEKSPGVIPQILKELILRLESQRKYESILWSCSCSMVEIYGTTVSDLLGDSFVTIRLAPKSSAGTSGPPLSSTSEVGEVSSAVSIDKNQTSPRSLFGSLEPASHSKTSPAEVFLDGVSSFPVKAFADAMTLMQKGLSKRSTRETTMNKESSRSHCVFTLQVQQRSHSGADTKSSKLNLVDLAGSERVYKSMKKESVNSPGNATILSEAIATNKSLSVLNSCIRALCDPKAVYVPYRESKLTWLLQDSLGGKATTFLIATLSPARASYWESLSTLQYASQAKKIPNELDIDQSLLEEAERARVAEASARSDMVRKYGFSESHLENLKSFYAKKEGISFTWLDPASTSWKQELEVWDDRFKKYSADERSKAPLQWIKGFQPTCADSSEPRYLKAKPGERIVATIVFSHIPSSNTIEHFRIAIDYLSVVTLNDSGINDEGFRDYKRSINLSAPTEPGLYMIRQVSTDATNQTLAQNYGDCESWYRYFIAWLVVQSDIKEIASPVKKFAWSVLFREQAALKEKLNLLENAYRLTLPNLSSSTNSDTFVSWKKLPYLTSPCSAIHIKFRAKDQGWGNMKGRVYLRLYKGVILFGTHLLHAVGHDWTQVTDSLQTEYIVTLSEPGDVYEISYVVGGGGGHSLEIEDFSIVLEGAEGPPTSDANSGQNGQGPPSKEILLKYGFLEPPAVNGSTYPALTTFLDTSKEFLLRSAVAGKVLEARPESDALCYLILAELNGNPTQRWTLASAGGIVNVSTGLSIGKYPPLYNNQFIDVGMTHPEAREKLTNEGLAGCLIVDGNTDSLLELVHYPNSEYYCVSSKLIKSKDVLMAGPFGDVQFAPSLPRLNQLWSLEEYVADSDKITGWSKAALKTAKLTNTLISCVCFSPNGGSIAFGGNDRKLHIFSIATGAIVSYEGHSRTIRCVCYDLSGENIFTGSEDTTIIRWSAATGAAVGTYSGHSGSVLSVDYNQKGSYLASASVDSTIRLWNVTTGVLVAVLNGHSRAVNALKFIESFRFRIISGGDDGTLRVWNVEDRSILHTIQGHTGQVITVAVTSDGAKYASGGTDKTVRVWDASTLQQLLVLSDHSDTVNCVAIDINGSIIASGSWDKSIILWDLLSGMKIKTLRSTSNSPAYVNSVSFSKEGKHLAAGGDEKCVWLYEAETTSSAATMTSYVVRGKSIESDTASDSYIAWFKLPFLTRHCEEIIIKGNIKDQGWGNLKGALYIRLLKDYYGPESYRIVCAQHDWEEFSVTLKEQSVVQLSDPGDIYELGYFVGGGGGHSISIKDVSVELKSTGEAPTSDGNTDASLRPSSPKLAHVKQGYGLIGEFPNCKVNTIYSKVNPKWCFDIAGERLVPGFRVRMAAIHYGVPYGHNEVNQDWVYESFRIMPKSNKDICIEVASDGIAEGGEIRMNRFESDVNQEWVFESGYCKLRSNTAFCIDMLNPNEVSFLKLSSCRQDISQRFDFIGVEDNEVGSIELQLDLLATISAERAMATKFSSSLSSTQRTKRVTMKSGYDTDKYIADVFHKNVCTAASLACSPSAFSYAVVSNFDARTTFANAVSILSDRLGIFEENVDPESDSECYLYQLSFRVRTKMFAREVTCYSSRYIQAPVEIQIKKTTAVDEKEGNFKKGDMKRGGKISF